MPIAKSAPQFEPAPEGTHLARCYACISLGTQHDEKFADSFKFMLLFELPHELIEFDGQSKPMTVSKEYTLSLGKKSNLRRHLESWRGKAFTEEELKGFEVSNVVGAPCQLTIVHGTSGTGNKYAKIEGVTGLAKGMECPPQVHPSIKYEIEHGQNEVFKSLPEWIRNKVLMCEEWKQPTVDTPQTRALAQAAGAVMEPEPPYDDSSVPF